jgi:phosphoribosylformimino-5-aminoimidazole carboxamide ribotide isomerase
MQIIPAIDIIDGKCVRLTEGDYAQKKVYNENPVEVAKSFEGIGLTRLHLVDLDGAKAGEVKNLKVLEQIASSTKMIIDFGGGIKEENTLQSVLNAGATYATIGSLAVKQPEKFASWLSQFKPSTFLLGADVYKEKISISGWLEKTDISIYDFIEDYLAKGVTQIFCTDIEKDGKLMGPSINLYQSLIEKCKGLELIASGGVSVYEDLVSLEKIGCTGAIVGKAIYENKITLQQLMDFN